jgi:hypothetical protein
MMNLLNMTKNYCSKYSHREYKSRKRAFEVNLQQLLKQDSKYSGNVYSLGFIKYDISVYKDKKS